MKLWENNVEAYLVIVADFGRADSENLSRHNTTEFRVFLPQLTSASPSYVKQRSR